MAEKLTRVEEGPLAVSERITSETKESAIIKTRAALPLRVNFTWTFFGNLVYAVSQWGMLSLLAKLGTPESVGQFVLGLAVTAPIVIFSNLSLRAVQATDARQTYQFGHYLALRLVTTLLAMFAIFIVAFVGYSGDVVWIIVGVGLAKGIEALSDVYYGLLQQYEQMDRIATSLIIKGPLSLGGLAVGYLVTETVLGGVVGLIFARLVLLLVYDVRSPAWLAKREFGEVTPLWRDMLRPKWDWQPLGRLAYLSLPLGVTTMLISLNTNIPRYFLERYWSAYELGIFAAITYLFVAGSTVISALGQSASPRLAKYYASQDVRQFRRLLVRLAGIGIVLGLGAVILVLVAGREILTILYEAEYADHVSVLLWLTLAYTISYTGSFLGVGMTAARYFRVQPVIFGALAFLALTLSYLLIPKFGMFGAVWVTGGVNVVQFAASLFVIAHAIRALQQV